MQIFTASHTLPKASFSEMILTEDSGESGGPGDYVITPVLVWRPGTKQCQRGKQGASKPDTVKVMNLADQVHLEEPEHLKVWSHSLVRQALMVELCANCLHLAVKESFDALVLCIFIVIMNMWCVQRVKLTPSI